MYQKEIIYLSLYNNDVKEGCVGYLKLEERQAKFRLELQIKNIPGALAGKYPIRVQSKTGWNEAGMLLLNNGSGRWTGSIDESVLKVEIILTDSNKINGQSRNVSRQEEWAMEPLTTTASTIKRESEWRDISTSTESESGRQAMARVSENVPEQRTMTKSSENVPEQRNMAKSSENVPEQGNMIKSSENAPEQQIMAELEGNKIRQKSIAAPPVYGQRWQAEPKSAESKPGHQTITGSADRNLYLQTMVESLEMRQNRQVLAETGISRHIKPEHEVKVENIPLYESKWEQLLATYEQLHPYGDNRVYVKLEPKDFVILPSGYQHLVNNSFLLHGFYNYRYLILGKEKDFYLGVPGVFYEREKMVALMFGFEAFECEGGNAEEGKFGYYLRKVEL